jgi:hypothetical protein
MRVAEDRSRFSGLVALWLFAGIYNLVYVVLGVILRGDGWDWTRMALGTTCLVLAHTDWHLSRLERTIRELRARERTRG